MRETCGGASSENIRINGNPTYSLQMKATAET